MKEGKSIDELANEIERQYFSKHDYIADSNKVAMIGPGADTIAIEGVGNYGINDNARRQLAAKLDIPFAYFQRLQDKHPDLLRDNVNTLLQREPQTSLVRTLDGNVRAILSDRYRPLEYFDLAQAIFPVIKESGAIVQSCEITETRMYIKLLMPWLDRELPMPKGLVMGKGHTFFTRKVIGALTIGNSETGHGAAFVDPGIFEEQCTNLATFRREGYAKMHIGKKIKGEDAVTKYMSDETKRLDDATVFSSLRDIVKATMEGKVIDEIVRKMTEAREDVIDVNPAGVVEVFAKKNQFSEEEKGGLLRHLTGSGEMTRYGLQWAVTRLANDAANYDRASELERLGGNVIELPRNDWKQLLKAA